MKTTLPLIAIAVLLGTGLSGCTEGETSYGDGIGLVMANGSSGQQVYYKTWTNVYHEGSDYESQGSAFDGVCGGANTTTPARNNCFGTAIDCSPPEYGFTEEQRMGMQEGVYVKMTLYEAESVRWTQYGREGEPGEEILTKRWDDLECSKGYTLVLEAGPDLDLYRCDGCYDPKQREGLEPLPFTVA